MLIFEPFLEVFPPLDQALGAPFDQIFAVGQVGHLLLGPAEVPGAERCGRKPWKALQQSLFILFQFMNRDARYLIQFN